MTEKQRAKRAGREIIAFLKRERNGYRKEAKSSYWSVLNGRVNDSRERLRELDAILERVKPICTEKEMATLYQFRESEVNYLEMWRKQADKAKEAHHKAFEMVYYLRYVISLVSKEFGLNGKK